MASKEHRKEAALKRAHHRAAGRVSAQATDPISNWIKGTGITKAFTNFTYETEKSSRKWRDQNANPPKGRLDRWS